MTPEGASLSSGLCVIFPMRHVSPDFSAQAIKEQKESLSGWKTLG
jgi:hypothetical protein